MKRASYIIGDMKEAGDRDFNIRGKMYAR